jgi:hypothetical protein
VEVHDWLEVYGINHWRSPTRYVAAGVPRRGMDAPQGADANRRGARADGGRVLAHVDVTTESESQGALEDWIDEKRK